MQQGDFTKMYAGDGEVGEGAEPAADAPPGEENGKGWNETPDGMGQMGLPLGSLGNFN